MNRSSPICTTTINDKRTIRRNRRHTKWEEDGTRRWFCNGEQMKTTNDKIEDKINKLIDKYTTHLTKTTEFGGQEVISFDTRVVDTFGLSKSLTELIEQEKREAVRKFAKYVTDLVYDKDVHPLTRNWWEYKAEEYLKETNEPNR